MGFSLFFGEGAEVHISTRITTVILLMSGDCKFRPESCFSSQQGHFTDFFRDKPAPVVVHKAICLNFHSQIKGKLFRHLRDGGERPVYLLKFCILMSLWT